MCRLGASRAGLRRAPRGHRLGSCTEEQRFSCSEFAFLVGRGKLLLLPRISSSWERGSWRAAALYLQARPQTGLCKIPASQIPKLLFKAFRLRSEPEPRGSPKRWHFL